MFTFTSESTVTAGTEAGAVLAAFLRRTDDKIPEKHPDMSTLS